MVHAVADHHSSTCPAAQSVQLVDPAATTAQQGKRCSPPACFALVFQVHTVHIRYQDNHHQTRLAGRLHIHWRLRQISTSSASYDRWPQRQSGSAMVIAWGSDSESRSARPAGHSGHSSFTSSCSGSQPEGTITRNSRYATAVAGNIVSLKVAVGFGTRISPADTVSHWATPPRSQWTVESSVHSCSL